MSMRDRVYNYIRSKGVVSSIDLDNWKDEIKHNEGCVPGLFRIPREARDLASDVRVKDIRRLEDYEKEAKSYPKKFVVFEYAPPVEAEANGQMRMW